MVFCVVCPLHNDLCGSTAMNSIVHFILNGCKKVFGRFAVYRVIYGSSINVRNFLVKAALAGADFLYFGNQMVEVIFIKDLPINKPILIQNISLPGKCIQHFGCPLTELRGTGGIGAVANSNNGGQGVEFVVIGLAIICNLCKFCTSCTFG